MFIVAESVEGEIWTGIAGIFATEEAACRFQESLDERWSQYQIFPVAYPDAYPFFLTGAGLEVPNVRPIRESDLERLLAEVPSPATEEEEEEGTILFNVYSVLGDSVNQRFPGELVLPRLGHFHVMPGHSDFQYIRSYLLRL